MTDAQVPDVPCNEFVELVTDYLDGALPDELVAHIDAHLAVCAGCRSVLAQWREVTRLAGRLAQTDVDRVDPDTRAQLMATFRRRYST
jgi:predicted anti-sigma-YlaC factor YlaD